MCTIVFERKEKNNIAVKHTHKYALDQKIYSIFNDGIQRLLVVSDTTLNLCNKPNVSYI